MRKILAVILAGVVAYGSSVSAIAAPAVEVAGTEMNVIISEDHLGMTMMMSDGMLVYVPRASKQLDSYSVKLADNGDGTLDLYYAVYGTHDKMSCVGAKKIVVEEEIAPGVWTEYTSYSLLYGYNVLYYSDSIEVSVISGGKYRATLTAYARDSSGSDTGTVTSKNVVAA